MNAQQLKNSILQMAVQGKLVPQDPNDEPASVLLERIRKEKEKLIKEGKIKKEKNPSYIFRGEDNLPYEKVDGEIHCISDLAPFEIPDSWQWCRVGDLFTNISGLAYKKESLNVKSDNMIRVLRGGNIGDEEFFFKSDDVMISSEYVKTELFLKKNYMITPAVSSLEHIGKIALVDKDYTDTVVGGFVLMLIPYFDNDDLSRYLLYAFDAKNHRDNCRNITHKSGQAFYNLSRERLMNLPIPIPPKEELKRINAQLAKILPFVSEYAKLDEEINQLNNSFPEQLKKSILQQAVMGKLVPQDPADEPASFLLEKIRAEKDALIKAGKLKKDKHESIIYRRDNSYYEKLDGIERCIDDEIPFDIPDTWKWCRFFDVIEIATNLVNSQEYPDYPHIAPDNIEKGSGKLFEYHTVSEDHVASPNHLFFRGQIIYSKIRPLLRKAIIASFDGLCSADMYPLNTEMDPHYILIFLLSDCFNLQVAKSCSSRVKMPKINQVELGKIVIPIPPLNEQNRIVEKTRRMLDSLPTTL